MDELMKWVVTTGGPIGTLAAYVIYQNIRINQELMQVIKDNTTAIVKLTLIIESDRHE